jgi:hypothetical protein
MFGMNVIVIVAITFLHPFGQPNMQWIWVVTYDLSANGVMPRHQFLQRNQYMHLRVEMGMEKS